MRERAQIPINLQIIQLGKSKCYYVRKRTLDVVVCVNHKSSARVGDARAEVGVRSEARGVACDAEHMLGMRC